MERKVIRAAINGYGRIGRCILRALYERGLRDELQIVAINEPSEIGALVHLTKFDSTHGTFTGDVRVKGRDAFSVNGDEIAVLRETSIDALDWRAYDIDVVLECSGVFCRRSDGERHLQRGARRVIFSSPATNDVDATVVYGFNHDQLCREHRIISNASCTTNCSAHIIGALHEAYGIERGLVTIVHSSMNDQPVIDAYHNADLRKNRSSGNSIIPVSTGLARGIERLFPQLAGRFEAVSLRVPTMNVSLMQLCVNVSKKTSITQVNMLLRAMCENGLRGIVDYTELPLVSCDYNHNSCSAVVDGSQTLVSADSLVTVMAWFDNEWGFANRMLDTTLALLRAQ